MFELPLLQKVRVEAVHEISLDTLKYRFGKVPHDASKHIRAIIDEKKLRRLNRIANKCPDVEAFREEILAS